MITHHAADPSALATPQGPPWLNLMLLTLMSLCAGRPAAPADHRASAFHEYLPGERHPHCGWHCPAAAAGGHGTVPGPPAGARPALECHHLETGFPTAGKHPQTWQEQQQALQQLFQL